MAFDAIRDHYDEWNAKTGTKIIAIATQKREEKIVNLIKKSNWPFEVYFDPEYKFHIATAKYYQKGQVELSFPPMFVFDKEYKVLGKLPGANLKLIDGVRPPTKDQPLIGPMEDNFEIDMEHYYKFFREMKKEK